MVLVAVAVGLATAVAVGASESSSLFPVSGSRVQAAPMKVRASTARKPLPTAIQLLTCPIVSQPG